MRRLLQGYGVLWTLKVSPELTAPQFGVLNSLADGPGIDQRQVGERISLDRSTVADVVNRLVRRGLIAKVRDPADGRRDMLSLTAAGRSQLRQARVAVDALREEVFASLDDRERAELRRLLIKVIERLEELRTTGSPATDTDPRASQHRQGQLCLGGLSQSSGGSGGSCERVDEHVHDLWGELLLAGDGVNSLAPQGRS